MYADCRVCSYFREVIADLGDYFEEDDIILQEWALLILGLENMHSLHIERIHVIPLPRSPYS